jgi:hypothetical protein
MTELRPSDRAALACLGKMTEAQQIALGARLLYRRLRRHVDDPKGFALACIRLQTYYGKPTP